MDTISADRYEIIVESIDGKQVGLRVNAYCGNVEVSSPANRWELNVGDVLTLPGSEALGIHLH